MKKTINLNKLAAKLGIDIEELRKAMKQEVNNEKQ